MQIRSMLSDFKHPMCVLWPFCCVCWLSSKQKGHVVLIIRLIFSKNIDESDKFCGDFFAKILIGFVSTNVILNGKYVGGLIWAVHRQQTYPNVTLSVEMLLPEK